MYIIGDIHGDITRMQQIAHLAKENDELMIFVGDFLDSFEYDPYDQIKCIDFAIRLAQENRAIIIKGNHEISYLRPMMVCTGWNPITNMLLMQDGRRRDMEDLFKSYVYIKDANLLITHAGLSARFAEPHGITLETLEEKLVSFDGLYADESPLYYCGRARGGPYPYGGIFWNDWNQEFIPVEGLRQVFGHTHLKGEIEFTDGGNYNIDAIHRGQFLKFDQTKDTFEQMTL